MAARFAALLPRLAALTLVWLLATSAITFAATSQRAPAPAPPAQTAAREPATLIVPDVRRQAYVFAKGILEDGGFAWRVEGSVQGYAANVVVSQEPAAGTELVDTGAPVVAVRLKRNPDYAERGVPENASPHAGTKVVPANQPAPARQIAPPPALAPAPPAAPAPAPAPGPSPAPARQPAAAPESPPAEEAAERRPAFQVAGAPAEPLDEMPLPERALLLERRLAGSAKPSRSLVQFWLYQHSWVVTGARFGWSGGAKALRILIRVDRDLRARWGIGARSETVARAALAEVRRRARS
jgi:PASTA domain-containing protein